MQSNFAIREQQLANRHHDKNGHWIQTVSGRPVWPLNPKPYDMDIHDIAHSLARSCRWTGHVYKFYSVAEHCVRVADLIHDTTASPYFKTDAQEMELAGLLHDASEAFISDIARPTKRQLKEYGPIEQKIMNRIWYAHGLGSIYDEPKHVKDADNGLLYAEARDLMVKAPMEWSLSVAPEGVNYNKRIRPWSPRRAEFAFLWRYGVLTGTRYATMKEYARRKWQAFTYFTLGIGRPPVGPKVRKPDLRDGVSLGG